MTRMMIRFLASVTFVLLAAFPAHAITRWQAVPDPQTITWTVMQGGSELKGACSTFDSDIVFDPQDMTGAQVTVTIDTGSCRTGDSEKDTYLPQNVWFDVAGFPRATFDARSFEHLGGEQYVAHGKLTLKGVTQPLDLPFTLVISGDEAHVTGEAVLPRLDFGIGSGPQFSAASVVGLDVTVKIDLKAKRK